MANTIQEVLQKVIFETYNIQLDDIELKTPPKKEMWDMCFWCFLLAKATKKSPMLIAEELWQKLKWQDLIEAIQIEWPFVNMKISKTIYTKQFFDIFTHREDFLAPNIGNKQKIIVDYIGMNVWKPMHIGHMCTPNIGQALINLYEKIGFEVISDSHIGDWGIIFGKLITAYKLWGEEEKLKDNAVDYLLELYVKITAESQKDDSIEEKSRQAFKLLSQWDEESKKIWATFTGETIAAMNIQLARLGVFPQYNIGESFYEWLWLPKMEDYPDLEFPMHMIVSELIEKKIATQNEDESVGVVFSDETKMPSCILQKRDATHGYLASDLACIKYRMTQWSPDKIIYCVDVRQQLHFKQAFEIAKQAGWLEKENKSTQIFHAYNWFISGKEGPFSTRKGNIIKLDLLLDEAEKRAKDIILAKRDDLAEPELWKLSKIIWIGAIKYGHLKKSRETDMIFDWDEFMTFEGNSGPYIQYAYVRARRILEKSDYFSETSLLNLHALESVCWEFTQTDEIELLKSISEYQSILKKTADTCMPHHLCAYSYELTKKFSSFYNSTHILNETNEELKILRLQLVFLFSETLKTCFEILGIQMPEKM